MFENIYESILRDQQKQQVPTIISSVDKGMQAVSLSTHSLSSISDPSIHSHDESEDDSSSLSTPQHRYIFHRESVDSADSMLEMNEYAQMRDTLDTIVVQDRQGWRDRFNMKNTAAFTPLEDRLEGIEGRSGQYRQMMYYKPPEALRVLEGMQREREDTMRIVMKDLGFGEVNTARMIAWGMANDRHGRGYTGAKDGEDSDRDSVSMESNGYEGSGAQTPDFGVFIKADLMEDLQEEAERMTRKSSAEASQNGSQDGSRNINRDGYDEDLLSSLDSDHSTTSPTQRPLPIPVQPAGKKPFSKHRPHPGLTLEQRKAYIHSRGGINDHAHGVLPGDECPPKYIHPVFPPRTEPIHLDYDIDRVFYNGQGGPRYRETKSTLARKTIAAQRDKSPCCRNMVKKKDILTGGIH